MLDIGRQYDLDELATAIDGAQSVQEKERYQKIAHRITHESAPVQSLRDALWRAFRAKDMYTVHRIQEHIQQIRLNETYGKSWGNNRAEQ